MTNREHFWRLDYLSDRQLLERLQGVLGTQRCSLAELIAHLGEVEERRLHLAAAHGSLFSYCVQQLHMSEDEACRRIELARLARKFPLLFDELASGRISLSVALLLKPVLTPDNHAELIAALRGTSLRTARELLAARFPSPDVPSRIRKLPERSVANAIPAAVPEVVTRMPVPVGDAGAARATAPDATGAAATPGQLSSPQPPQTPKLELGSLAQGQAQSLLQDPPTPTEQWHAAAQARVPRHAQLPQRIDPRSAERYRIQFTADTGLKQKLELARDLLRHSNPGGDLACIVSRALDLLLQELMQRRFGARRKDKSHRSARPVAHAAPVAPAASKFEAPQSSSPPAAEPAPARVVAAPSAAAPSAGVPLAAAPPNTTPAVSAPTSRIARAARRTVLERDGLGCRWIDAQGTRCGSAAWLELDHRHPSGKGGRSEPENLRLLCRAHNRFAAERAYGRDYVERAIRERRRSATRRCRSEQPPPSSAAPA